MVIVYTSLLFGEYLSFYFFPKDIMIMKISMDDRTHVKSLPSKTTFFIKLSLNVYYSKDQVLTFIYAFIGTKALVQFKIASKRHIIS